MSQPDSQSPPNAVPAPPPRSGGCLRRGCGCLTVVILLSCCCCGGVGWYWTSSFTEFGETVESLHAEVIPENELDAAWEAASPSFREKHTKDELTNILERYRKFRNGTRLPDSSVKRIDVDGQSYLIVKLSVVAWWADVETFWFVCDVDQDGRPRLIGIRSIRSGQMDKAIPDAVKPHTESRSSGWDWD